MLKKNYGLPTGPQASSKADDIGQFNDDTLDH